ncbi:MAG: 30S ribosomal protein S3 [Armatimonadetes bacterium]|nr:30S ribosomal protein S3 [Candidatus Hippobium faecium]
MGQKVNPIGLRVGIIRDWESKWYANPKDFAPLLYEDYLIRKTIKSLPVADDKKKKSDAKGEGEVQEKKINKKDIVTLSSAGIASIQIERPAKNKIKVTLNVAKPGIIIGRGGAGIENVKKAIEKICLKKSAGKEKFIVNVNVVEIASAFTNAQVVAESIQQQIEKRVSFKRAMKQAVNQAMKFGAKGIKVRTSGRLGGAEMARIEKENAGKVPLHTLRADIDYGFAEAWTQYGHIGVKVWIYKGDVATGTRRVVEVAKPKKARDNKKKGPQGRRFDSKRQGNGQNRRPRTNKGDKA